MSKKYANHPRYGSQPRKTGLDPNPNSSDVNLHWNTNILSDDHREYVEKSWAEFGIVRDSHSNVIKGTAIVADIKRQTLATIPVTHYYDLERKCSVCKSDFIFFAEEQKYWYEELGFPLEADCINCFECRKKVREIQTSRKRYEELFHIQSRILEQEIELNELRLSLIAEGVFNISQLENVRNFMNLNSDHTKVKEFTKRISEIKSKKGITN